MSGVVEADVAEELSEDESDTEIDKSLLFPPTYELLTSIFDLPPPPEQRAPSGVGVAPAPAPAPAEEGGVEAEAEAPEQAPHEAIAEAVDEGHVEIAPERILPVDVYSEQARAQAELSAVAFARRRKNRLRLRERLAKLNEYIENPRHQLSLS